MSTLKGAISFSVAAVLCVVFLTLWNQRFLEGEAFAVLIGVVSYTLIKFAFFSSDWVTEKREPAYDAIAVLVLIIGTLVMRFSIPINPWPDFSWQAYVTIVMISMLVNGAISFLVCAIFAHLKIK